MHYSFSLIYYGCFYMSQLLFEMTAVQVKVFSTLAKTHIMRLTLGSCGINLVSWSFLVCLLLQFALRKTYLQLGST